MGSCISKNKRKIRSESETKKVTVQAENNKGPTLTKQEESEAKTLIPSQKSKDQDPDAIFLTSKVRSIVQDAYDEGWFVMSSLQKFNPTQKIKLLESTRSKISKINVIYSIRTTESKDKLLKKDPKIVTGNDVISVILLGCIRILEACLYLVENESSDLSDSSFKKEFSRVLEYITTQAKFNTKIDGFIEKKASSMLHDNPDHMFEYLDQLYNTYNYKDAETCFLHLNNLDEVPSLALQLTEILGNVYQVTKNLLYNSKSASIAEEAESIRRRIDRVFQRSSYLNKKVMNVEVEDLQYGILVRLEYVLQRASSLHKSLINNNSDDANNHEAYLRTQVSSTCEELQEFIRKNICASDLLVRKFLTAQNIEKSYLALSAILMD